MLQRSQSIDPHEPRALSVHLTLESHNAVGPSIRRLSGSDCVVITFPLTALWRVTAWPELEKPGVFVLIKSATGNAALRAAVGKAQNIAQFLIHHERDYIEQRFLQIATLTSADDDLDENLIDYVGQRLITTLRSSGMVQLDTTWPPRPPLQTDLVNQAGRFFRDALLLLGPVEPMMGLLAATIAGEERRHPSNQIADHRDAE